MIAVRKKKKWPILVLSTCFILLNLSSFAQSKAELKAGKTSFEGHWYNKKSNRHLTINFDDQTYATINDWTGKLKANENSIDAYKAYLKSGKLVMPEDKTDLRSPYCEIIKQGSTLLYRCKAMNAKDNKMVDQVVFVKLMD